MKNVKKGMAWMLVCVMLMGLVPISVYSAVEGTAESITAEEVTEVDAEDVDKTEATTEMEEPGTTEIVVATESTTEAEGDSDADSSTELATEIGSEEIINVETVEKTTEVPPEVMDNEKAPVADVEIFAQEEAIIPLAGTHDLTVDSKEIYIDGVKYSSDNNIIKPDSQIVIELKWSLPNTNNSIEPGDRCTYSLLISGVEIKGVTSDAPGTVRDAEGTAVGKYYIENGTLYMYFNDDDAGKKFLSESQRIGTLRLEGIVDMDELGLDDNGDGQIQVGDDTYNIHVDEEDRSFAANVEKSAGELVFDAEKGMVKREFTIIVTADRDVENLVIEDVSENAQRGQGSFLIDKNSLVGLDSPQWVDEDDFEADDGYSDWASGFTGTIPSIAANETVTITYWAYVKKEMYEGSNQKWSRVVDTNDVTMTDEYGRSDKAEAPFYIQSPYVEKGGQYDESEGTITWTITIYNPDGIDLVGTTVTDTLQKVTDYDLSELDGDVIIEKEDGSTEYISIDDFINGDGYKFLKDSTAKKYTFTYTLQVSEDVQNYYGSDKKVENKVDFSVPDYNVADTDTGSVDVGRPNPFQQKEGNWSEDDANAIDWKSTVVIPEDGLSDVIYQDWFDDSMTLVDNSVVVSKVDDSAASEEKPASKLDKSRYTVTEENYEYNDTQYEGFAVTFHDAPLEEGTYIITYRTRVKDDTEATEFWNYANLNIGGRETEQKSALVEEKGLLSKGGTTDWGNGGTSDIQTWTLTVPSDNKTLARLSGHQCIIEDTLPESCSYIPNSAEVNYGEMEVTSEQEKVIFDINKVIEAVKALRAEGTSVSDIKITYQTRITDMDTFLESTQGISYTNHAELKVDDAPVAEADANVYAVPVTVIKKDVQYDKTTAPEARYTIDVNPNGYDLVDGDALTITDILPDNFELDMNTIKVYEEITVEWRTEWSPITIPQPTYDGQTLTLQVPDGKHIQIAYSVIVNRPIGDELTPENSTNSVEAGDVTNGYAAVSLSSKQSVVVEGNATAGSESRSLTINKYAAGTNNLLNGAEFRIKMKKLENGTLVDAVQADAPGHQLEQAFFTGEDGSFTISGLLYDIVYEMWEETPPAGYQKDDTKWYYVYISQTNASDYANLPQQVEICRGAKTERVDNKLIENSVFFSKQAVGGTTELPGATITLYDANGNVVTSWVSEASAKSFKVGDVTLRDANGNVTQLAAGTYTMRETGAPDGYTYAEDITFTIDGQGKITLTGQNGEVAPNGTTLIMRDKTIDYIYISKKAIGGNDELPGAHIVLKERESGKVVAEWTSGSEAYKIAGTLFKAGMEYVLTETVAPDGYEVTEKIIFKIDRNGTLSLSADNTNKDAEVTAYNGSAENNQVIMRDAVSETTEEKTTEEKTTEEKKTTTSKKTGDKMPIVGMAMLCGMSVAGYYVLQRKKKQKK